MKLFCSMTSPYARKLRVLALELGIALSIVETSVLDDPADLLAVNPLGKVPALVLDDGTAIVDSPVIAAFLLRLVPDQMLLPADGAAHWQGLTSEAIADGILDAAIILRFNAMQGITSGMWPDRQYAAIDRALSALASRIGDGCGFVELCAMVAIEYLDLRWPAIDWRSAQPKLKALHERLAERPSLKATRPPV